MSSKQSETSKREFDPIRPQVPSYEKIICRTCKYRDKSKITFKGKEFDVGTTRDTCEKYTGEAISKLKPYDVLFMNDICEFYEEDK